MHIQKIGLAILVSCLFATMLNAQSEVKKQASATKVITKTESFKVLGNCGMCQRKIEAAAKTAGAVKADWDSETDILTVTFDSKKSSASTIQKAVALVGYDNVGFKAPDDVYNNLHGCCQYDRSGAPSTAKPCTDEAAPEH